MVPKLIRIKLPSGILSDTGIPLPIQKHRRYLSTRPILHLFICIGTQHYSFLKEASI